MGQAYVQRAFPPQAKQRALKMVKEIEQAMERDIMAALEAAVAFAEASPFPTPEQATEDAFAA